MLELALENIKKIETTLLHILDRTQKISTVNDFLLTPSGVDLLDVVCMRLLAMGEEVKKLDKYSDYKLLINYPTIPWKKVMGLRDIIAHQYFEVDATQVFNILQNDIPSLLSVIRQMKTDVAHEIEENHE
jgi:uncharacterized protein with HEPN domain